MKLSILLLTATILSFPTNATALSRTKIEKATLSFVGIRQVFQTFVCNPKKKMCFPMPEEKLSGSGFIVKKTKKYDFVLTANHVCSKDVAIKRYVQVRASKMTFALYAKLQNGKKMLATVIKIDKENDICLLRIKKTNYPAISITKRKKLKKYEKSYTFGSPSSIFFKANIISLHQGFFNGNGCFTIPKRFRKFYKKKLPPFGFFSVSATGGASGSPIVDKNMKVIGILHSHLRRYNQISMSPTLEILHKFLKGLV